MSKRTGSARISSAVVGVMVAALTAGLVHAAPAKPAVKPDARPAAVRPPAPVWSLAFRPDGSMLAAGDYQRVRFIDPNTHAVARSATGLTGPVRCLAWSNDGSRLAAGCGLPAESGEVWLFSADGAPVGTPFRHHKDVTESVCFSGAGDLVFSAGTDEKVVIAETAGGKVRKALLDHTNRITGVALSPRGRFLATSSLDRTVKLWNAEDYKPIANIDQTGGQVFVITFLTDTLLAAAGEDGNVRVFTLNEGRSGGATTLNAAVGRTFQGSRTPVLAMAGRGTTLAYGGTDRIVNVVEIQSGRRLQIKDQPDDIYSLAISPDARLVAAGLRDGRVRFFALPEGKPLDDLLPEPAR